MTNEELIEKAAEVARENERLRELINKKNKENQLLRNLIYWLSAAVLAASVTF